MGGWKAQAYQICGASHAGGRRRALQIRYLQRPETRHPLPDSARILGLSAPPPALRGAQRAFITIDCPAENLEPREPGLPRQSRELRMQPRRNADAHLRVVAHALSVHAPWRPPGLPHLMFPHDACLPSRLYCGTIPSICAFTNRPARRSTFLYSKVFAIRATPMTLEYLWNLCENKPESGRQRELSKPETVLLKSEHAPARRRDFFSTNECHACNHDSSCQYPDHIGPASRSKTSVARVRPTACTP